MNRTDARLLLAMSEETSAGLQTVALAAGCSLVVGLVSVLVVHALAQRHPAVASWLAPIAVVASVGVGVVVSAWAMLLGSSEVATMAAVLAASASIAVAFGLILAREVRRAEQRHAAAEEERQRQALLEAERRRLVSWLSHDLRTPLARMKAITEALDDDVAPDRPRYLAQLGTEVDGLAVLVDDLLALSRLTSPETPPQRVPVAVSDALSDAVARAVPLASAEQIALVGRAEEGLVVSADPRDLHRALANLIDNAIRHTPPGGSVSVTGWGAADRAVIEVADECGGIPDSTMAKMFDPGWHDDPARTSGPDARSGRTARTGLGLAILWNVIAQHGGTVAVRNNNRGCVFRVELPLVGPEH